MAATATKCNSYRNGYDILNDYSYTYLSCT